MTPEDHIDAVLQQLASGRVFPDVAPVGTATPYITYQFVGEPPDDYLSGDRPDKQYRRAQVNVWAGAGRRAEASELGKIVEDAICAATWLQVQVLTGRTSTFDEETNYRGTRQEFNLFC